jgi:hypothetical protein
LENKTANGTKPVLADSLPYGAMAFHKWMVEKGWHEHSSKEYFYRSKDFNQWPPDQTATDDELLRMFFMR